MEYPKFPSIALSDTLEGNSCIISNVIIFNLTFCFIPLNISCDTI